MAKIKPTAPLIASDHGFELTQNSCLTTARQVQTLSGLPEKTVTEPKQSNEIRMDATTREARVDYDPEALTDDVLEQEDVASAIRGFVLFITFILASLGGIILSIFLALYTGFRFLPTLAVYYAVTNAVILTTVVVYALLNLEDPDQD